MCTVSAARPERAPRRRDLAVRRRGDGISARHRKTHSIVHSGDRPPIAVTPVRGSGRKECGTRRLRAAPDARATAMAPWRQSARRSAIAIGPAAKNGPNQGNQAKSPQSARETRTGSHRLPSSIARPGATALRARRIRQIIQKDHKLPKEELLEFEGLVTEILPDARYRVQLDNGHALVAYTAGRMKKNRIKTLAGDRVTVEVSPYDLGEGANDLPPSRRSIRFGQPARRNAINSGDGNSQWPKTSSITRAGS